MAYLVALWVLVVREGANKDLAYRTVAELLQSSLLSLPTLWHIAYGRGEEARLKCPDRKDHGGRASDLSGEAGAGFRMIITDFHSHKKN
jgi:hypothetical protein